MSTSGLIRTLRVGSLNVEAYDSTDAMARAAGEAAAARIRELAEVGDGVSMIFATGASQMAMLNVLTSAPGLPWEKVVGFHMDEYLGLSDQHPASFRRYLREHLTSKVKMRRYYEVDGSTPDPERTCRDYAKLLREHKPQLCLLGIGENGHLAFNDPAEADFNDPLDVKVVTLDDQCRQQQVSEGWYKSLGEVPRQAITLTIPTLLRVPRLIATVPGERKAHIVRRALTEEISTRCPATVMRTHPNTTVYLDPASSVEIPS